MKSNYSRKSPDISATLHSGRFRTLSFYFIVFTEDFSSSSARNIALNIKMKDYKTFAAERHQKESLQGQRERWQLLLVCLKRRAAPPYFFSAAESGSHRF